MKRILLALLFTLIGIPAYAQQWDQVNGSMQVKSGPAAPLVIIDQTNTAANRKILSLRAAGTEKCSIDIDGDLVCTGTFTVGPLLAPTSADCTAALIGYSFQGDTDTGWARTAANTMSGCAGGTDRLTISSTAVTSTVLVQSRQDIGSIASWDSGQFVIQGATDTAKGISLGFSTTDNYGYLYSREVGVAVRPLLTQPSGGAFTVGLTGAQGSGLASTVFQIGDTYTFGWSDVSLSRGAANRLDLASGDSFRVISGNINIAAGEFQSAGDRVNYNLSAYGVGTAYAFTNTAAAIDFGTTDPSIVLDKAGTYDICAVVNMAYNGATVVAETASLKVRRTNNTAADLSVVLPIDLRVATTLTNTEGTFQIPCFSYTTSATDDSITIFANVSAALGAGTIDATAIGTYIRAVRLY